MKKIRPREDCSLELLENVMVTKKAVGALTGNPYYPDIIHM
ncbi:hypothetical Protein YC6258_04974 [Gynuella sunshinyii YC6258]|uniref:Uncharacterized protein n=1 Tax=Gynuella sunshinyii YC6258 TaxID=1445510 RepID=A0A0C5VS00_9GAMM|nr:hypothetical Protein YC6258_04974 [Gynuella sunshinyii YC6258]